MLTGAERDQQRYVAEQESERNRRPAPTREVDDDPQADGRAHRRAGARIAADNCSSEQKLARVAGRLPGVFKAGMGAEAVREIVASIDLDEPGRTDAPSKSRRVSGQRRKKATKRLRVVEAFRKSGNQPGVDVLHRAAGHPARPAPDGAVGRWPLRHVAT